VVTSGVINVAEYRRIVVLTGAGISAGSGLPTYRGAGGLWNADNIRRYATAAAVVDDPRGVWGFFAQMRSAIAAAVPNAAHFALARLGQTLAPGQALTVLTQNVDGLHQLAGSKEVVELHGSLHRSRCTCCDYSRAENLARCPAECPECPNCSAPMRPAVTFFNETLSADVERTAKQTLRNCDLFLAVGTSGTVSPASNFVRAARFEGARTVYVNLEPMVPVNPEFRETVLGPADEVLPQLLNVTL
jgi:NAD-dependent deacetylase